MIPETYKKLIETRYFCEQDSKSYRYSLIDSCFKNACKIGDINVVKYLSSKFNYIRYSASQNGSLYNACLYGNTKLIKLLIDVYQNEYNNSSALEMASEHDFIEILQMLEKKFGKNVLRDGSAIMKSLEYNNLDIYEFIVSIFEDDTFLLVSRIEYSCQYGHYEIVKSLIEKHYHVFKNIVGKAFVIACRCGHLEIAKLIKEHYPDINVMV